MDDHIYDPLMEYKNKYGPNHKKNVEEYFDELVLKSNINVEENKETIKKIKTLNHKKETTKRQISKYNTFRILMILFIVIVLLISIKLLADITATTSMALDVGFIAVSSLISVLFIFLIFKKINPLLKKLKTDSDFIKNEISELINLAKSQMKPLNDLFTDEMGIELFKKTIPLINLDRMFDSKRYDYLVNKFGLDDVPELDRSTLFVKSGDINGNPFYIANDLVHTLGTKAYTGSIIISWVTYTTVNGKRVAQTRTQTLTETILKPYPYYNEQAYLVYGNEAAPDLKFTRDDSNAENMDQKQIDKHVKREEKILRKKAEKDVKKGGNFTTLANSEFEVLFNATDRNNEVQFRLLFTPLAQKQLLELMKDKTIGYGDNFDFIKNKKINIITPEHLNGDVLNVNASEYYDYDFTLIKSKFIDTNVLFFKAVYFTFAPILAIPLYQQQKPHEYIYKDLYDSYVSFYEHEIVANKLGESNLRHPESNTRNILKTSIVSSKNNTDKVKVTAFGYKAINRTEFRTRLGGDGRMHTIPIHWVEYLPVTQESVIDINIVEDKENKDYKDHLNNFINKLKNNEKLDEKELFYLGNFIARIIK